MTTPTLNIPTLNIPMPMALVAGLARKAGLRNADVVGMGHQSGSYLRGKQRYTITYTFKLGARIGFQTDKTGKGPRHSNPQMSPLSLEAKGQLSDRGVDIELLTATLRGLGVKPMSTTEEIQGAFHRIPQDTIDAIFKDAITYVKQRNAAIDQAHTDRAEQALRDKASYLERCRFNQSFGLNNGGTLDMGTLQGVPAKIMYDRGNQWLMLYAKGVVAQRVGNQEHLDELLANFS